MNLEHMLVEESATIKEAIERLEKYRCKNVYIVDKLKLKAAISDGDVRRFLLKNGDIDNAVKNIANYSPTFYYEMQKEKIKETFLKSDLQSIPVLNYNNEVVSIAFRNEAFMKSGKKIKMPVVIMAGGKGRRLYPYTKILPKALIPIGEIPIVEHIINRLYNAGCSNYYVIVNHKKNMIKSYFENVTKRYQIEFLEEEIPLGTGGGLSLLKKKIDENFILSNCDVIIDSDYAEILNYHKAKNNFITLVASKKCDRIPYGVITLNEAADYQEVLEKPENNYLINTGFYIVNAQVIVELKENKIIGFPDIVEKYKKQGKKIGVYIIEEKAFMDMGQLGELENMRKQLRV